MIHRFRKLKDALLGLSALLAIGLTACTTERDVEIEPVEAKAIVFSSTAGRDEEVKIKNEELRNEELGGNISDRYARGTGFSSVGGTLSGSASRAATGHPIGEMRTEIPDQSSFAVYAYQSILGNGSDIALYSSLSNQQVSRDGSEFPYTPVAKWPIASSAKLSFFGYYPWTVQTSSPNPAVTMDGSDQKMTITYTVPTDPAEHVDLMYARTGLKSGYDAVNMIFKHALTWIRFSARKEDYTNDVKITKIRVCDAVTKGTLTVLDPDTYTTDPVWTLTSDKSDYSLTAANNGLLDVALSGTLRNVTGARGDLLVLPQSVANVIVEVEATNGGEVFSEPFVFPLSTSPDWEMNKIVTYEITLGGSGMRVATKVNDWNNKSVNVVYDGQHYLEVSEPKPVFDKDGGTITLDISSNYNITDKGFPAGIHIEYPTGFPTSWISVNDAGETSTTQKDGDLTRSIEITANPNTDAGATDRNAEFTVVAGNMNYVIKVSQSKDPWLTISLADIYILDGTEQNVSVTSITDWNVHIKQGSNFINGQRPIANLATRMGTAGTDLPVKFTVLDIDAGTEIIPETEVTLVFSDTKGLWTKEIKLPFYSVDYGTPSNSYILKPGGKGILIPVSRANESVLGTQISTTDEITTGIIWSEYSEGVNDNTNIKILKTIGTGSGGYILVTPGSLPGNTVVDVKLASATKWSWHIWVTDYDPETDNHTFGTTTFMDRNLGARGNTGTDSYGLVYQWGRKDPFSNPTAYPTVYNAAGTAITLTGYNNADGSYFIANPAAFSNSTTWAGTIGAANSWNNGTTDYKTVYDPCPAGWRVPKIEVWSGLVRNTNFFYDATAYGWFWRENSVEAFYPLAGLRTTATTTNLTMGRYWAADDNTSQLAYTASNFQTPPLNQRIAQALRCVKE